MENTFRVGHEAKIAEIENAMNESVAIFNEHLSSIFADDDEEDD